MNAPTPPPGRKVTADDIINSNPVTAWVSMLIRYYGPLVFSLVSFLVTWIVVIGPQIERSRVDQDKAVQAAMLLNEATKRLERIEMRYSPPSP